MSISITTEWDHRSCKETALALQYYYELPIVLCRGERPIAAHWDDHAYSVEEIEYEFDRNPDLNVGLLLGRLSGLMEICTINGDGMQSEYDFFELVGDMLPLTPTYTSRTKHHRLFRWDERLASLSHHGLRFKSVSIRTDCCGAYRLLPPSVTEGIRLEWRLHPGDCRGQFEELPYFAVEKLLELHRQQGARQRTAKASLS